MKVGVIDLGSNTSKLLIAQIKPFPGQQNFKILEEKSLPCRIFTLTEKKVLKISQEGSTRLVSCIDKFQNICQSHQTDHLIVVATEALRKAENSQEVTLFVEQQTSLKIKILSGQEEAKAVVKGLQTDPMINDLADYFALDIGGGSLELTIAPEAAGKAAVACVLQWRRGWRRDTSPGGVRSAWERSPDDGSMRAIFHEKSGTVRMFISRVVCVCAACACAFLTLPTFLHTVVCLL